MRKASPAQLVQVVQPIFELGLLGILAPELFMLSGMTHLENGLYDLISAQPWHEADEWKKAKGMGVEKELK